MKNNIVFKFIAIVLCAASLLGAVGSAAGILVLTEGDLYRQTVEQMLTEMAQADTKDFAVWLARNYASTELGGCPEALTEQNYSNHWFTNRYDPAHYGYAVLDAEGNELLSYKAELKADASVYTHSVSGKYMHLVSEESESEIAAREAKKRAEALGNGTVTAESDVVLPPEGAGVTQALFADAQGYPLFEIFYDGYNSIVTQYTRHGEENFIVANTKPGFLFANAQGYLIFHTFFSINEYSYWNGDLSVEQVFFVLDNGENLHLIREEPVGILYVNDQDNVMFLSNAPEVNPVEAAVPEEVVPEATEETVAETVPQTVPETQPETLPPETVAATEPPVETWVEETGVPSAASAVPEETAVLETVETAPAATEPPGIPEVTEATETAEETTAAEETLPAQTQPAETQPLLINGKGLEEYQVNTTEYYDKEDQEWITARFVYLPMPELQVEIYLAEDSLVYAGAYEILKPVREYRNLLLPVMAGCLLMFAVFAVYLCTAAGRKPKSTEVRAGGLNRIPLDLYLCSGGFLIALLITYLPYTGELLSQDILVGCGLAAGMVFLCCLIFVGFCFAFVAQIKTPGGFWWRSSLCGLCIRGFMKSAIWLEEWLSEKGLPFLARMLKKIWVLLMNAMVLTYKFTEKGLLWLQDKLGRLGRWCWKMLHRFLILLPVSWQWLLVSGLAIFLIWGTDGSVPSLLFALCIILYGSHCYGVLADSTRRMSKGDLDTKVDDKLMVGCFESFAEDLNALADVAMVAAQKHLKSERMKTELITNVSHDIKTPLTSIINYVDLLQKPHTEAEAEQYLEVLDRQSQRLKKLIDDLMDMSKASTGNMAVEITMVDAVESVNQALGEFADKLERAQLIPVFRHNEERVPMMADGRLVWRVLSNLLSNAVKYAMPGTRLYIDLMSLEGKVVISLKNISREELNMDAEELMERFVRGDDSRNTEGSGLGLNIAKSLMDLQKGQLQLLVDGDLFKVTLIFPGV